MSTDLTIKAAMSVARDVADGRLDPDELGRAAANECRELFGVVAGPDDPLWPLHVDIARQVLALGGVSADELSEWLAVARSRELEAEPSQADMPSEPHQALAGADDPGTPVSSADGPHSPENDGVGLDTETWSDT